MNHVEGIILSYRDLVLVFMSLCLHEKRERDRLIETWKRYVSRIKDFIRFTMKCPVKIR